MSSYTKNKHKWKDIILIVKNKAAKDNKDIHYIHNLKRPSTLHIGIFYLFLFYAVLMLTGNILMNMNLPFNKGAWWPLKGNKVQLEHAKVYA